MENLDRYNDRMLARAETDYLDPDYGTEPAAAYCDCCGKELYDGDRVTKVDGMWMCDGCLDEWIDCHSKLVTEPEPDWDSMPGRYDSDI